VLTRVGPSVYRLVSFRTPFRGENHNVSTNSHPDEELEVAVESPTTAPKDDQAFREMAYAQGRALLAWLSDDEAKHVLLGHTPGPADDQASLMTKVAGARSALALRPPYEPQPAIVPLDDPRIGEAQTRPDLKAEFWGMSWTVGLVDLREVLTFQKIVSTEGLDARVEAAASDSGALFELCLPTVRPKYPTANFKEHDGKTFTISSLNPNLRIVGADAQELQVSPDPSIPPRAMRAIVMVLSMGSPYLQIARWAGRTFVRDGHHRAVGLLARGVHIVPAVIIDARSWKEVVGDAEAGALPYDVLFGTRPPRLADFWDETLAADGLQPAVRKVIRIRGEEFVVPR
jgi:hypothetical protein